MIASSDRAPMEATTRGTGELIAAALDVGACDLLLAAGGSATTDFGAGALAALGVEFRDAAGRPLDPRPAGLDGVRSVSLERMDPRLHNTPVTVLSDVDIPLSRNLATFGEQKGFTGKQQQRVADQLQAVERAFGFAPGELLERSWLGAGGGIAAGFVAVCGARVRSGAGWFLERSGAREAIAAADVVLTAEGCFDASSLAGKLTGAVLELANEAGVRASVVAASAKTISCPGRARLVNLGLSPSEPGDRIEPELRDGLRAAAATAVREAAAPGSAQ
jgi:glycerate kinase